MKGLGSILRINRRVLLSGLALLPVLSGAASAFAQTQSAQGSSLDSWNEGPAKQAILD
jgi:hypothetical protein